MIQSQLRSFTRRDFLAGASSLGAASLLGVPTKASAEPPPETRRLRIFEGPVTCIAPEFVAKELLHAEGFKDVQYVKYLRDTPHFPPDDILAGDVDITFSFIPTDIRYIDRGAPIVIVGASHAGCVELIARTEIRSTRELKGRTVAADSNTQSFVAMFAAYVGLDPRTDINWVSPPIADWKRLFVEGKIDAFMDGPPVTLELRERGIGHALVSTTTDKPWSDYLCCLIASTKEYVSKNPVATKRALRAILKAGDLCAVDPSRAARLVADRGLTSYDNAFQMLRELPYGRWREFDPNDSLRFFALRMHDVGAIKSTPQQIIDRGTDWRFLNELRRELKA
jgi:NitT/TauT family transport system substrate-binding protein